MQKQAMDAVDTSDLLCRTCLRETDVSVDIFSEIEPSVLQMLTAFTRIKPVAGDLLPQKICKECQTQVINCYNFKLLCEDSDSTLWERARRNNENTQDLCTGTSLVEHAPFLKSDLNKEDYPSPQTKELFDSVETVHDNLFQVAKWHYCEQPFSPVSNTTSHMQACNEVPVDPATLNDENTSQDDNNLGTNPIGHRDESVVDSDSANVDLEAVEPVFLNPNCRCPQCGRIFRSARDVRRHEATHDPLKPYHCTVGRCKWSFASQAALLVHGQVNHVPGGGAGLACRACGNSYRHARSLRQHLLSHAHPHRFTCQRCNKGFKLRHHLKAHEITHSKEKPFLCQQCGVFFATKERLHLHMRRHGAPRQYTCSACTKTFLTAYELKLHSNVHSEERAYMCAECGRQFRSKRSLARHHARHTTTTTTTTAAATAAPLTNQKQPPQYECCICKKSHRRAAALERHMRTHLARRKVAQKRSVLVASRSDPSPLTMSPSPPTMSPSLPAASTGVFEEAGPETPL